MGKSMKLKKNEGHDVFPVREKKKADAIFGQKKSAKKKSRKEETMAHYAQRRIKEMHSGRD
jgi:hypothetical protein